MKKLFEMPSIEVESILSAETVMTDTEENVWNTASGAGWWA